MSASQARSPLPSAPLQPPIDLHLNYPLLGTEAELLREYLRGLDLQAAQYAQTARPASGGEEDRAAVAAYLRDSCGLSVERERVFLSPGGHHAIGAAVELAGLQGRSVAVDAVTYSAFLSIAQRYRLQLLPCAGDADGMLPQALEAAVAQCAVAVYLMPTVHNPLGTVMPLERREALSEIARRTGLTVLEDEAYAFLESAPPAAFASLLPEQTFYLQVFSKPFAPSLRLAPLVVPSRYVAAVELQATLSHDGVSYLLAAFLRTLLENGEMAKVVSAKRADGAARQQLARALLRHCRVQAQANSYHLWVEPERVDADALVAEAERRGVLLGAAAKFTAPGATVPNAFRLALGGEPDPERARRGVEIVAELLQG